MDDIEARTVREQAAVLGSIRLLMVLAGVDFAAGMRTSSFVVLFDGFFALIDASMGGLALLVSRLIQKDIRCQGNPAQGRSGSPRSGIGPSEHRAWPEGHDPGLQRGAGLGMPAPEDIS